MITNSNNRVLSGSSLEKAEKVLIMLHGRGDSARSFIGLSRELELSGFAVMALQAEQNTWYPNSFLAPVSSNQPYLDESLGEIKKLAGELYGQGFAPGQIYLLGFSQGACLALEFAARNAKKYGGIIAFTGGLIGEGLSHHEYRGDFDHTPVFIGASDHDPHVPEQRIDETVYVLEKMGAKVEKIMYPGMGHTINREELDKANALLNLG
jgi:phospholipase/carboxylesterase